MLTRDVQILLVEDNDDDVVMTLEAFADANITNPIEVLPDGQALIDHLEACTDYDDAASAALILLDINMPRKNGFEALEEIKANPRIRHIPVIMLTTSDREEDIVKSFAYGACSYISKPVEIEAFTALVKQFSLYWSLVSRVPGDGRGSH
ncbi:MAG: response regulator [Myxococcales bacterium]|nr:response regulator [Myxococcales bacterium]